jgi:uncharacterized membrane protein YtjA (UPF0391 family)
MQADLYPAKPSAILKEVEESCRSYLGADISSHKDGVLTKMVDLLGLAVLFLIIAFVAYLLGARGIAGFTMEIAKILIIVFVILFVITLIFGSVNL